MLELSSLGAVMQSWAVQTAMMQNTLEVKSTTKRDILKYLNIHRL